MSRKISIIIVLVLISEIILGGLIIVLEKKIQQQSKEINLKQVEIWQLEGEMTNLESNLNYYKNIYYTNLRDSDPLISKTE